MIKQLKITGFLFILLGIISLFGNLPLSAQIPVTEDRESFSNNAVRDQRLKWFREARFGMFIHWGLYAVPAGEWKGKQVGGIGEWIMYNEKIPVAEYGQLAKQFNPTKFNAQEIVNLAKNAGMKYIVITSKHHDGFAMYHSKVSKYNIYDATSFKRDPLKELADAANKAGIKLCFYYSQTQDWYEPNGNGNEWDFKTPSPANFQKYLDEKVKPQVTELLTNYGPIGLIWFDTPRNITKQQSQELIDLVRKLQPDCLVSGRIGHNLGDYDSGGDNQISAGTVKRDWEAPVTMNDTWGFKKNDNNWKSTAVLIEQLVKVSSQNGNYLLNIGPKADGSIPPESVERLTQVGDWLKVNKEAVYGTSASPFPYDLPWGIVTTKPGKIFLHVFKWQPNLTIFGIKNKVQKAYLLADNKAVKISQKNNAKADQYSLSLQLPAAAPDKYDSVIVLETNGDAQVDPSLMQQPDNSVMLPAFLAKINNSSQNGLKIDGRGVAEKWFNSADWMDWNFKVSTPGTFEVEVITSEQKYGKDWEGGHVLNVEVAGQKISGKVENNGKLDNPANPYWKYVVSKIGTVKIDKAGTYTLALKPETIKSAKKLGLTLVSVKLAPSKK